MTVPPPDLYHDFGVRPLDSLDDLLACEQAKSAVLSVLKHPFVPPKLFLQGPPGSGKSTIVNGAIRLTACEALRGHRACDSCPGCEAYSETGGRTATSLLADSYYKRCKKTIDLLVINCRSTTIEKIRKQISSLRRRSASLRIIHLEEAASLYKGRLDETITDLMDDPDLATCRWIATAVTDGELDEQFRRRWAVKVHTTAPEPEDLAENLARLCRRHGIKIDHPDTWRLLAEHSWCVVGQARSLLAVALVNDPPSLTDRMVRDYPFPRTNPWKGACRTK